MNRRGFLSMLAGAAGAPLVPWRVLVEPLISLPSYEEDVYLYGFGAPTLGTFSNVLTPTNLTEESLEPMLQRMSDILPHLFRVERPRLIVSPQVKYLIDTDPGFAQAARMALEGR